MTTKWSFVEFENATPHTVPNDYLKPLIRDLTKRGHPLETRLDYLLPPDKGKQKAPIRNRNWLSLDAGGSCVAGRPVSKLEFDGLVIHVPCDHVGYVRAQLEELTNTKVRYFSKRQPYVKLHIWATTVVFHLWQARELVWRLRRIENRAEARSEAHFQAWKNWMGYKQNRHDFISFEDWLRLTPAERACSINGSPNEPRPEVEN